MAMTERGDNVDHTNTPRLITDRVYEEFKPNSEWRKGDRQDTLLVYLPGFEEEHIKVTTEGLNRVRIRGERFIAGNKWSRFKKDYQVAENCETRGFRSNFGGGVLTLTMPKTKDALRSDLARIGRETFSLRDESITNYWWPKLPKPGGRYEWRNVPGRSYNIQQVPRPEQSKSKPTTAYLDLRYPLIRRKHKTNEKPFEKTKQEEALPNPKEVPKEKKPQTTLYTLPPQPKPTSISTTTKQEPYKRATEAEPVPHKEIQNVFENPTVREKSELEPKRSLEKRNVFEKPSVGEKTELGPKRSCMPVVKAGLGIGLLLIVARTWCSCVMHLQREVI